MPISINSNSECVDDGYQLTLTMTGGAPQFNDMQIYSFSGSVNGQQNYNTPFTYGSFVDGSSFSISVVDSKNCAVSYSSDAPTCNTTNVYPGDVNHDGIVNNQDDAIHYLYYNYNNNNIPRQQIGILWQPYPCPDWGFAVPEAYGNDIKHFDCNGDGSINAGDKNAIILNWGETHGEANFNPINGIYSFGSFPSNTKIYLQATDDVTSDLLIMNIVMERTDGMDLNLFGGFFTIEYLTTGVMDASVVFNNSWLGNPNFNLNMDYKDFPEEQKVEIAFSRTDGMNTTGSGVVGQVAFNLNTSNFRTANDAQVVNFEVVKVGAHNNEGSPIGISDQAVSVNVGAVSCEPSISITQATPFQNLYQSAGTIQTNGSVIVGANQQVEYRANRVRLNQGFSSRAGSKFRTIYNNNCGSSSNCDPLFEIYPNLINYLNPNTCADTIVEEYFHGSSFYFLYIKQGNQGTLYLFNNGILTYYGADAGDASLPMFYGPATGLVWECGC